MVEVVTRWLTNDDGLQLTALSPCLDAGDNTFNATNLDLLQHPRVDNGTIDCGPYEYQSSTSSVNEALAFDQSDVSIYPNPTKDQITILGSQSELVDIKVFNAFGQVVITHSINEHLNETSATIDLSSLSKGLYYIKTETTVNKVFKQ